MKLSLDAKINRYLLVVCTVLGMQANAAFSKASDLASFRKQAPISFADFVKTHLDTNITPDSEKKDASVEHVQVAVNAGDLTQLRGTQKMSFATFVSAEKPPAPKPRVAKQQMSVAAIGAPAKAIDDVAKISEPNNADVKEVIKIVVEDRKGKSQTTDKILVTPTVDSTAVSPATKGAQVKHLTVLVKKSTVTFSEAALQLTSLKDSYAIKLIDAETGKAITSSAKASMFVRNEKVAKIVDSSVKPLSEGQTELYVIAHGKAHFLPISVESELSAPKLELANEFFKLDVGVEGKTAQARIAASTAAEQTNDTDDSLASKSDVVRTSNAQSDYRVGKRALAYRSVRVQLVDDRSDKNAKQVFPISRAKVKIIGTKFVGYTDGLGIIELNDLPAYSKLHLAVDDPMGRIRSALLQLDTERPAQILTLIRHQSLDTYENALGTPPTSNTGTLCGVVKDDRDNQKRKANVAVTIDAGAIGPYYFNQYGFLDLAQRATGIDGKFCFFNVDPGPISLHFFTDSRYIATHLTAAYPGSHNHEDFYVYDPMPVSTKLAMFASASEQLGSDNDLADSLKTIDMVDLIPLGRGESMTYTDAGVVETVDGADIHNGNTFVVNQSSDFETTFYALAPNAVQRENVVSLFPRGFVDDMAVYAQVSYDPSLGRVVVEHNVLEGQVDGAEVRLIDQNGQAVGDGWYYSDFPKTKAIFFNLQPGRYSVVVETKDGHWLAADTVYVFTETLSFVRTGSPVIQK